MEKRYKELIKENDAINRELVAKKYEPTYYENQKLKADIRDMYKLQEKNDELKEDLNEIKTFTFDKKMK